MEGSAIFSSLLVLKGYCEMENFRGWDPYDGLNSKVFQATSLKKWNLARMFWIQAFKHNSINLRKLLFVPKGYNPKSIALFLTAYCNLYKYLQETNNTQFGNALELQNRIHFLADMLISLQSKNYSGACWGYNFDWQSKAFFLPKHTPTIVATSFAIEALLNAYVITKSETYLNTALSSASFIVRDLNRIPKKRGFMFSYSPKDQRAVYNASLLGTKSLSLIYNFTKNEEFKHLAFLSAQAVCDMQNADGSFPHSDQVGNQWRDNFHTAFKLESLVYYQKYCSDKSFIENIENGYIYWRENFFDNNTGIAFYYEHDKSIIDLHCAAQSIPTFYSLGKYKSEKLLAAKILEWAICNMQNKKGYFYFQKIKNSTNKIPYMRWPNAWMFYGMTYFLIAELEYEKNQGNC